MKNLMSYETYVDTKGNKTQFSGGEQVKVYNFTDRRDEKPEDTKMGTVKRVENDEILVEFDNKGMKSTAKYKLDHFVKQGDIFVEK